MASKKSRKSVVQSQADDSNVLTQENITSEESTQLVTPVVADTVAAEVAAADALTAAADAAIEGVEQVAPADASAVPSTPAAFKVCYSAAQATFFARVDGKVKFICKTYKAVADKLAKEGLVLSDDIVEMTSKAGSTYASASDIV